MAASDADRAWAAGYFDGEGFSGNYRGNWMANGTARLYARAGVGQKDRRTLDKFHAIVGMGQIKERTMNGQPFYEWTITSLEQVVVLANILSPHLGEVKMQQLQRTITGTTAVGGHYKEKLP